jgi:hypothetical protein
MRWRHRPARTRRGDRRARAGLGQCPHQPAGPAAEAIRALAERIGADSSAAIEEALRSHADRAIADLEAAARQAGETGREAATQLRDQLSAVNELAGNLERRVAHARQRAEEQVDNDFAGAWR